MTAGDRQVGERGTNALAKIAVLLRTLDDRLAALKHEACPGRLLTSPEGAQALEALAPLEDALAQAVARLGLERETADLRRRLVGPLNIMWADLMDMAPEHLEKRWGAHDVPEEWEELRLSLLRGVEDALEVLSHQGRSGGQHGSCAKSQRAALTPRPWPSATGSPSTSWQRG
jgi:hypothetical protein